MRALVIGSVKQYPTETAAWKAVSTLRLDVNHHTSRPEGLPETFEQLVEHLLLSTKLGPTLPVNSGPTVE